MNNTSEDCPAGAHIINSPEAGTFYRAFIPDQPFVEVGDAVKKGRALCVIDLGEINYVTVNSDIDGTVAEIYHENHQTVEIGSPLFALTPQDEDS